MIWWRDVPIDDRYAGETAKASRPFIRQVLIAASDDVADQDAFERKLYVIRRADRARRRRRACDPELLVAHDRLQGHADGAAAAAVLHGPARPAPREPLALVHSRFSTNTFPSWTLAHPFRMIAHNGEINTLRGNANWMRARESQLQSELFGDDLEKIMPVIQRDGSDSATFDNVLELLVLGGRSIPHAMMMMIPEAYRTRKDLDADVKGFYDFHSCLIEPWDGPAAVVFTDGKTAGATLDRNGLRPGRWIQDTEGYVVLASEAGVLDGRPRAHPAQGAAAARQDVPARPRAGQDHRGRRTSSARSPAGVRTATGTQDSVVPHRRPARP